MELRGDNAADDEARAELCRPRLLAHANATLPAFARGTASATTATGHTRSQRRLTLTDTPGRKSTARPNGAHKLRARFTGTAAGVTRNRCALPHWTERLRPDQGAGNRRETQVRRE